MAEEKCQDVNVLSDGGNKGTNIGMSFADYFKDMPDEPEKKSKR